MNRKEYVFAMVMQGLARTGAVAAISGAVLLLVATALHPLEADPGDLAAAFREYAADDHWVTTHLGQFFAVLLLLGGLIALRDTLKEGRWPWVSRLAVCAAVTSLATTAILQAIDGVALKVMVDTWSTATGADKIAAFHAALAVRQIEVGVASLTALLFGTTVNLYGVAILPGDVYPKWAGWMALIGGVGTIVGGLLTAHTGFSPTAMTFAMPFNLAVIAWMIVIGVMMWRRADQAGGPGAARIPRR